jgi:hypothetical protein
MLFRRNDLLDPLTYLTSSEVKFEWLPYYQQAFEKIKQVFETEINPFFVFKTLPNNKVVFPFVNLIMTSSFLILKPFLTFY